MPPVVIDVRSAEDTRDVVHRAVQALVEGKLVALPTETVYGVAARALDAAAVERLVAAKGRAVGQPLALAIKGLDDALDYVPDLSPLAQRLARRCWPGPVTLVVEDDHPDSLVRQLPPSVRAVVVPDETIGLRAPAHPLVLDVLRMLAGPLALSSANRSGQPDSLTAQQVVEALGEDVYMVLDDGPSRYGQPSTVVRVDRDSLKTLRQGVVSERTLRRLSSMMILMVCTGNTCRSPMAEGLFREHLARRVGCKPDELEERGFIVQSAGLAALPGGPASPEAVDVMGRRGIDLSRHESQPMTAQLANQADVIFAMTRTHQAALTAQWPAAGPRTKLLCADGDVGDPIGGPPALYEQCAKQIEEALEKCVKELQF